MMPWPTPRLSLVTLCFAAMLCGASAQNSASAFPPATPRDYIALIRTLADSPQLTDPEEVGRLLGTSFAPDPYRFPEPECTSSRGTRSHELVRYKAPVGFWYLKASWPGELPAQSKDFQYSVSTVTLCSDRHAVTPDLQATIQFHYLRGRVCITEQDIKQFLPEAKGSLGSEGTRFDHYYGYTTEAYGVIATLAVGDNGCVSGVTISQREGFGSKAKRVEAKLKSCLAKRMDEPPFKYPDYEFCGTFDALMETEP